MNDNDFVRKDLYQKDIDFIANEVDNTNKRIDDLSNSISHQLTWMGVVITSFQIGIALIIFFLTK